MRSEMRLRRGTTAQREAYTPLESELIHDTDTDTVWIGDGSTAGGLFIGPYRNFVPGNKSGTYAWATYFGGLFAFNITAANILAYVPILIAQPCTLDRLGIQAWTAGAAGNNARIGLYANEDGRPKDLIVDGGEVDVSTSGIKLVTISEKVVPGTYWIAVVFEVTGGAQYVLQDAATIQGVNNWTGTSAKNVSSYYHAHTYGALPSTAGTLTEGTGNALLPFVRIA